MIAEATDRRLRQEAPIRAGDMQSVPIGRLCASTISPKLAWSCSAPPAGNRSAIDRRAERRLRPFGAQSDCDF
jgi:hypothetical protein